jgi:uncharacterized membrane protein
VIAVHLKPSFGRLRQHRRYQRAHAQQRRAIGALCQTYGRMDGWKLLLFLHIVAMAFFVGGQLVLAAAVVPVAHKLPSREPMRQMARRFGYGTLIALGVLIVTGSALASHYDKWGDPALHIKLTLVAVTAGFVIWHMKRPAMHALEAIVFLLSLAIVWLGIAL